jgi:Zn-finger nucleic acid-binding protein
MATKDFKGIEVESCPGCEGLWLDVHELDELEDKVFAEDELKGTTVFQARPSDGECPQCNVRMKRFNYRYYDLELDFCPQQHGFWLDKGEERRVLVLMKEEASRLKRKFDLEGSWGDVLTRLKSKNFVSKVRDLFK